MLLLFPQHPEFTCVVVVVLGFGDASAYIGGKLVGGRRLPWNPKKTWAGTISFMLVAVPFATLAYFLEANTASLAYWGHGGSTAVPLGLAAICATAATVTAAIAESWETQLTDNLRVGVAASVAVIAAHYLTAGLFFDLNRGRPASPPESAGGPQERAAPAHRQAVIDIFPPLDACPTVR